MSSITDLLFPRQCISCNTLQTYLCPQCVQLIKRHKQICIVCHEQSLGGLTHSRCTKYSNVYRLIIATEYSAVMKKIIHQIKYKFSWSCINEICDKVLSSKQIQNHLNEHYYDIITCISLTKFRTNWRGFNLSEKIAKYLERKYEIPYLNTLSKNQHTTPQALLSKNDRYFNTQGTFSLRQNINLLNKNILLVDDVLTTGSTVESAAHCLAKTSPASISILVLSGKL